MPANVSGGSGPGDSRSVTDSQDLLRSVADNHFARSSRSHRGPTTSAPRASARRRSSRSAVTSVTACSDASAMTSTSISSPLPPARRTITPPARPPCAPSQALPSRTTMTGWATRPESTAARTWSTNSRLAPARSRHQPVGRDPTTLAASMTSTASVWSLVRDQGVSDSLANTPWGAHGMCLPRAALAWRVNGVISATSSLGFRSRSATGGALGLPRA